MRITGGGIVIVVVVVVEFEFVIEFEFEFDVVIIDGDKEDKFVMEDCSERTSSSERNSSDASSSRMSWLRHESSVVKRVFSRMELGRCTWLDLIGIDGSGEECRDEE